MKTLIALILSLSVLALLHGCGEPSDNGSSDVPTVSSETQSTQGTPSTSDTVSRLTGKELYMEELKNNDIFKQYDESDWRSHAYDYKLVALTFDDGPAYKDVDGENNIVVRIVETLLQNDGRGTFFFTGRSLAKNGFAVPQYALNNGFELANHSYNHASLKEADYETAVFEIVGVNNLYYENLEMTPTFFRGGGFTTGTNMWKVLAEQDMIAIASLRGGNGDHSGGSATVESLVDRLSPDKVSDGEIVCLHSTNTKGVTPDALAIVLPQLYEQGFRFCTVSELFAFKGVDLNEVPRGEYIKKVVITENGLIDFN